MGICSGATCAGETSAVAARRRPHADLTSGGGWQTTPENISTSPLGQARSKTSHKHIQWRKCWGRTVFAWRFVLTLFPPSENPGATSRSLSVRPRVQGPVVPAAHGSAVALTQDCSRVPGNSGETQRAGGRLQVTWFPNKYGGRQVSVCPPAARPSREHPFPPGRAPHPRCCPAKTYSTPDSHGGLVSGPSNPETAAQEISPTRQSGGVLATWAVPAGGALCALVLSGDAPRGSGLRLATSAAERGPARGQGSHIHGRVDGSPRTRTHTFAPHRTSLS